LSYFIADEAISKQQLAGTAESAVGYRGNGNDDRLGVGDETENQSFDLVLNVLGLIPFRDKTHELLEEMGDKSTEREDVPTGTFVNPGRSTSVRVSSCLDWLDGFID